VASLEIDELLTAIRGLARAKRRELLERMARELTAEPSDPLAFIGSYADEPELIDAICDDAMNARERDSLQVQCPEPSRSVPSAAPTVALLRARLATEAAVVFRYCASACEKRIGADFET
jgi:hypothetical protein